MVIGLKKQIYKYIVYIFIKMTYRIQFTISTSNFTRQKKDMKKLNQKRVIDYLKDMGRLIPDINKNKRKLIQLFSGQKEPFYIPLKVKCIKQRLRFHKSLPKAITGKGKGKKQINPDSLRDPQVSMVFEFTPFSEKDEERAFHEYIKSFNEEEDCLMKLKKSENTLQMMYMSKLTRFVHNIYNSLQGDWELFCNVNKLKGMKIEMFNITYLKI